MNARIYIEGGSKGMDSKELQIRCREGFRKILEKCGFKGRMPRLNACGGRDSVFKDFSIAHGSRDDCDYVAMWIDSEDPMVDIEKAWQHLENVKTVGRWLRPDGADDDQVLFMTTCMETWIAADRDLLRAHFGRPLRENALPPLVDLEQRDRGDVQRCLVNATCACPSPYSKGRQSYELLGKLNPGDLAPRLPSFVRVNRILSAKLQAPPFP